MDSKELHAMKETILALASSPTAVAFVAVVGTFITARAALADVSLKRRLETGKRFAELAGTINNVTGTVGLYEQVAACELLASFSRSEPELRGAARAVLDGVAKNPAMPKVAPAAALARRRVPAHEMPLRPWRRR